MADIRISQLTELDAAPSDSDVLVINDVSVNTTKQITFGNLLKNYAENVIDSDDGARCTGDFVVDNELILNGDLTTNANITLTGGILTVDTLNIDAISPPTNELTIGTGLGTNDTLKVGVLDINQMGNLDGSGISLVSNLKADDNKEFRVGDGGDGKFYHDGTNTYLEEGGVGSLLLQSNGAGVAIRNKTNSLKFIECLTGDGKTSLYYNGGGSSDKKLETRNLGITVTGEVNMDELQVNSPTVPSSSTDATGGVGQIAWDANYIYVCVSATGNRWKRLSAAMVTF